jgi:uncharacterized protein
LGFDAGDFRVLGEIGNQYVGIAPGDKRMDPYWALAEKLDIPVVIHMGEGYPGAPYLADPQYRARLGHPFLLEDVLVRFPRLRVCVMHYGSPLVVPSRVLLRQLKKFIDAGFGKRVMFGSDQMVWPELIERSIEIIERAPFLSEEQKRDIFYNNAARFLRLSEREIARHHGR